MKPNTSASGMWHGRRTGLFVVLALLAITAATGCEQGRPPERRQSATWSLLESLDLIGPDVDVVTTSLSDTESVLFRLEEDTLFQPLARGRRPVFDYLYDVAIAPNGNVFALELPRHGLNIFDVAGNFVRTVGEALRGPGELSVGAREVFTVGVDNETVVVRDSLWMRFLAFDSQGEYVETFSVERLQGSKWQPFQDGGLLFQQLFRGWSGLLRLDLETERIDTILPFTYPPTLYAGAGGKPVFVPAHPWTLLRDGRLAYGVTERFEIFLFDQTSRVTRVIQTDFRPARLSRSDRRTMARIWEEHRERLLRDVQLELPDALRQLAFLSPVWPAFAHIFAGPDGTTWVQRMVSSAEQISEPEALGNPTSYGPIGSEVWDVFDASGQHTGILRLPDRAWPLEYHDGFLYVRVSAEEQDGHSLARMRVIRLGQ